MWYFISDQLELYSIAKHVSLFLFLFSRRGRMCIWFGLRACLCAYVCVCVHVCVFEPNCRHMCMKGIKDITISQRRDLFEKSLLWCWLDLAPSFFGGRLQTHVHVCVLEGYAVDLSHDCVPTTAHSANLTDSLVQFSSKRQPTSKVQTPDCWSLLSAMRWQRRGCSLNTSPMHTLNRLSLSASRLSARHVRPRLL